MTEATFDSAEISKVADQEEGIRFRLETWFTYSVSGKEYAGSYAEEFRSLAEAEHVRRSLKQGPLYVRYNPSAFDDYLIDPYRDVRAQ
jgi:hypothetical protein